MRGTVREVRRHHGRNQEYRYGTLRTQGSAQLEFISAIAVGPGDMVEFGEPNAEGLVEVMGVIRPTGRGGDHAGLGNNHE